MTIIDIDESKPGINTKQVRSAISVKKLRHKLKILPRYQPSWYFRQPPAICFGGELTRVNKNQTFLILSKLSKPYYRP